jgi:hypothetical protein
MKTVKTYKVITTQEVVYTFPGWPTKDIDGVPFVTVVKRKPHQDITQPSYWMRKDSLELVK